MLIHNKSYQNIFLNYYFLKKWRHREALTKNHFSKVGPGLAARVLEFCSCNKKKNLLKLDINI